VNESRRTGTTHLCFKLTSADLDKRRRDGDSQRSRNVQRTKQWRYKTIRYASHSAS